VHGQPISAQTKRRDLLGRWKQQIRDACLKTWLRPPLDGNVRLSVTYYSERARIDGDNLLKPIQDALQGILYSNDHQITDTESHKRNIDDPIKVRNIPQVLAMAFSDGRPFVYIEIWHNPDQRHVH
jgi:Holliday junction resolvase RusA-like endonuclease